MRPRASWIFALAVPSLVGAALACGTDAVAVETCRRVENARCERAAGCGIDLGVPRHRGGDATAVTSCQRYYRDACLHGIEGPEDPGEVVLSACLDAISTGSCDVVKAPELAPACAFLVAVPAPPAPAEDAATDADVDAGPDATIIVGF